jgi:hypothetical protein
MAKFAAILIHVLTAIGYNAEWPFIYQIKQTRLGTQTALQFRLTFVIMNFRGINVLNPDFGSSKTDCIAIYDTISL